MRTIVYHQGFNRIENHTILKVENSKLNHLLDEERRMIESLAFTIKRKIELAPNRLFDANTAWKQIQNHHYLQSIRRKIDLLTKSYPQFLGRVTAVRLTLQERFFNMVNTARLTAQTCTCPLG